MATPQRILIVEDDSMLAGICAQQLEAQGFAVSFAANGEDGLKLVKKDRPDLVLLDLLMPKMNGFELLERVKADAELAKIPVLVFTNLAQKEDVERCMSLGAAGYMIKAHTLPQEMVSKVKSILAARNN